MEPTIQKGDYIIVNKLIPGARVYRNLFNIRKNGKVATIRFKGIRTVERNDVLVFNYPYSGLEKIDMNLSLYCVKRCVAVPGDTFYIDNGIYKVKNAPNEVLGCLSHQKMLASKSRDDFDNNTWCCLLDDANLNNRNIKNFAPIYIPKKGDELEIDSANYQLYKKIITYEADKPIENRNSVIMLGDSVIHNYTFNLNYYFMAGDYIFNSLDSRYWGLLPEDHIIGKAALIWKSKNVDTGEIRWDRVLRRIK